MKNKIILSSILLIVLILGLSAISATDTNTTTITSIEKQTIDTTTSQTIDNKEKIITNDNKELKSTIKDTKTEITPKKEIKTKEITTQNQKNNKEIKTTNKTLKKESEINYYVSNDKGSDTNDGSIDKPYKTINQAITQTTKDNIYNIHITEGKYTGVGNTNLTINGDYKINFIGDGINKTIIDGDGKYTINPNPGYVWGSSPDWWWYINCSGNWGMNITKGTGYITLSNMNIQHMLATGGADISLNPYGGITNYGNLSVNNVLFYQNLGGVGASIQNKNNATLTVNNSIFQENRKSNTTGNFGAGIYNNGTASVTNSLFKDNLARWGTLTNDGIIDIVNCTFRDGISYDGSSTYKFGSGIAANTGGASFSNPYDLDGLVTNVINCTFINNEQTDIYVGLGNLFVNNCNFNQSTGIYTKGSSSYGNIKTGIYNSTFTNMKPSNLFSSLSVTTGTTFAIYLESSGNITIQGNVINLAKYGYGIYVNSNTTINNNTLNKYIYIKGKNNKIMNNIIKTNDIYAIEIISSAINGGNNEITNNTLYSQVFTGDKAVLYSDKSNTIKNNIPVTGSYINLTDDNYNIYFDKNGVIKTDVVENGSIITITGNITNKNLTFSNIKALLLSNKKVNIVNGSINIINNASMIIQNTTIKNNDKNQYGILINSPHNFIKNNNIFVKTTNPYNAIIITQDNNNLESNIINITSTTNNTGILIKSADNTLKSNKINITTDSILNTTSTGIVLNSSNENYIYNNYIYINTNKDAIGTELINSSNITVQNKIYIYTSENAIGTQLQDSKNNRIVISNMKLTSNKTVYGIKAFGNPTLNSDNTFIKEYGESIIRSNKSITVFLENTRNTNVVGLSGGSDHKTIGDYARGILTKNTENTNIFYLTLCLSALTDTNPNLIAIEQINSQNTNITAMTMKEDSTYNNKGNFLKLVNTTNTYIGSAQDVSKTNININDIAIIMENSNNNIIENISITTETDYTINLTNSNNNKIINNYLNGNNFSGGNSTIIQTNSKNSTLFNNTPEIIILTNDNYNDYFINQVFVLNKTAEAVLGSNIYNKNMTFNHAITLKNPRNYTIYNGTISLTHSTGISNLTSLQFNVSDDRKTVINIIDVIGGRVNLFYSNIIQYNKENQAQTIYVNKNSFLNASYTNITLYAPEINSDDYNKLSTAVYCEKNTVISYGSITVNTTKTEPNGKIIGLYGGINSDLNMTINAKNNAIGVYTQSISNSNITIHAENNAIGVLYKNNNITYPRTQKENNINLYSNNQTIGLLYTDILLINYTYSNIPITIINHNINLTSQNTIGIKLINTNITMTYNNINTNGTNNTPIYIENNKKSDILFNNFISNVNAQNIFKNMGNITIKNNNMIIEKQKNLPLIIIENAENAQVISNFLKTENLMGKYAVKTINVTNLTIEFNKPGTIITNENYNQYFTNQILNSDIDVIELGSNFYNKNMIFNHKVLIENPNNYTIYNGTLIFTENATNSNITGINIHNTDDRQTSLKVNSTIIMEDSTIYQENNNTPAKTIIIEKGGIRLNHNNITTIGSQNVTIISLSKIEGQTNIQRNNIYGKGSNITAIYISNSKNARTMSINGNNIILKSDNPITAIRNINSKGTLSSNTIIVKTKNYNTPIIEIINHTGNFIILGNYIESEDVCAKDAIKVVGTGRVTYGIIKPTNGNYKTQMNITLPSELKVGTTYPIIINVTSMLDKAVNGDVIININGKETTLTLTDGIATYNYTPTKDGETTIKITYTDNEDKYLNNTITQTVTVNKINTILKVDSVKTTPNTRINIPITLTNEFENPLNGTVTVIDQYNNTFAIINIIDGKGTFTKIFRGNFNQNLTFIYDGTEIYNAINTTINVDIHKLSTTVTIDPINAHVGDKINLKATVTDEDGNPVTEGRLVFKVNGKTIKDTNGNIIYATIKDGIAMIENYTVPANWFKIKSEISAVYGGTSTYKQTRTNNTIPMNITKKTATMTMTTNTTTTKPGETIKITVKITEKDNNVNEGRVLFKVNGKTMRDNEGYIIYHEVKDGLVTITYTIPENARAQDYTFTCVYGNKLYERCDVNSTITVVKN